MADLKYPRCVCRKCGLKAAAKCGTKVMDISTWHTGTCDVCGTTAQVTEPRDFGYPTFPKKHSK